jgi:DNA-binding CsgD family transcriptional regulator
MRPNNFNNLEPHNPTDVGRLTWWLVAILSSVAVLAVIDVVADIREGTDFAHVAIEILVAVLAVVGVGLLGRQLARSISQSRAELKSQNSDLEHALETTRLESEKWRENARDLMRGLGAAIEEQFVQWELSPAESEVALLLLKGLSHKEVANVRGIAVATARQQAAAVYRKAGISGKQELLAFFLEDLMLPGQPGESEQPVAKIG